jgi:hypothetical protein
MEIIMKLKFFSYSVEQCFKTSPSGERLFFHAGVFRPRQYIIPDEETEKRLFKKLLWLSRIFWSALILVQPFLFIAIPNFPKIPPLWFVLYVVATMVLYLFVNWLVFRKELLTLKRTNMPILFRVSYRDEAKRHSTLGLVVGFLGSIGFVWACSWMVKNEINPFIGWVGIILFGLCAVVYGFMLYLKLTKPGNKEVAEDKTEA